jgi:tetratricopeptide (TPR) repeat protein
MLSKRGYVLLLCLFSALIIAGCGTTPEGKSSASEQGAILKKPAKTQDNALQEMRETRSKIYAVSSKGEINLQAQRGSGFVRWDETGVTIFMSKDYLAPQNQGAPGLFDAIEKLRGGLEELYTKSPEDRIYLVEGDTYMQWDDKGLTIHIESRDAEVYTSQGNSHFDKDEYDQAISDYNKVIQINPKNAYAYLKRGDAYYNKKDYDPAISDFSKSIEINPNDARSYRYRGDAYNMENRYEMAIQDYDKAIRINPGDATSHNNLAWILATAKEPRFHNAKRAVELALRACKLSDWKEPVFIDTLAAAYARVGDFDNAIKWQGNALQSYPKDKKTGLQERLRLYQEHKPWPPN